MPSRIFEIAATLVLAASYSGTELPPPMVGRCNWCLGTSNRPDEYMSNGHEAGALGEFSARRCCWNCSGRREWRRGCRRALELLHEVGAEAAAAKRLMHFHIDVAIGAVVVKQDSAFGDLYARPALAPFAAALSALDRSSDFVLWCARTARSRRSGRATPSLSCPGKR